MAVATALVSAATAPVWVPVWVLVWEPDLAADSLLVLDLILEQVAVLVPQVPQVQGVAQLHLVPP